MESGIRPPARYDAANPPEKNPRNLEEEDVMVSLVYRLREALGKLGLDDESAYNLLAGVPEAVDAFF
eukprot:2337219-Rhodomonas_salina.1